MTQEEIIKLFPNGKLLKKHSPMFMQVVRTMKKGATPYQMIERLCIDSDRVENLYERGVLSLNYNVKP